MKTNFDIEKIINKGKIENELDFERALIADRKLRILSKEEVKFKGLRKKLRDIIEKYENDHWVTAEITPEKINNNDLALLISEKENEFIESRKQIIRKKLKEKNLTQQDLGTILGHSSKSYMSELINGITPFTLKDLVIIHRILKINIKSLIPVFLSLEDQNNIQNAIIKLNKPSLKLSKEDFELA